MDQFRNLLELDEKKGYCIQGIPVLDLCKKYKSPFYIYDLDLAVERWQYLTDCFKDVGGVMHFAMKALESPPLLLALKDIGGENMGASIDAVSPAEVKLALELGYKPEKILYTANSMENEEIEEVHKLGVLMNFDSIDGLKRFGKMFPGSDVCLRFNPDVVAGENVKVQTAGDLTKFGILFDKKDMSEVLAVVKEYDLKVVGLHEHTGSGIKETEKALLAITNLLQQATRKNFPHLRFIDCGGGFKAPYEPEEYEHRIDYRAFAKKVMEEFGSFRKEYGTDKDGNEIKLCFEPGKYIASECGALVIHANTLKDNRGRHIVGTNSGFPHLPRVMMYGAYHAVVNVSNWMKDVKKVAYTVAGNICESGDFWAENRELNEVRPGDSLIILNAGAYCESMASDYNGRPIPMAINIWKGMHFLSRPAETTDEWVQRVMTAHRPGLKAMKEIQGRLTQKTLAHFFGS